MRSDMRRIYCLKYRDVKTGDVFWPSFADPRERGDFKRSFVDGTIEILNEWNEIQHFEAARSNIRKQCAWCKSVTDDLGPIAAHERVSHGMCSACSVRMRAEMGE